MKGLRPKMFVDFDGTITKVDVGNAFFRRFGDAQASREFVEKWKSGELSGRDLTIMEARFVRVDESQALEFIEGFEIDPTFKKFASFCEKNSSELTVLSDGLDFYIKRILELNGISGVPFYSNNAHFEHGTIRVEFPYQSDCPKCGNCKGYQILTRTGIDDVIVYVGNGFSDRCGVQYADIIFAKDELLKYCEDNNITFFPFEDFDDVTYRLEKLFRGGEFKKRHRAELRRREAYLAE